MTLLALFVVIVACALDALSTIALIRRGGREAVSAWVIGGHPTPRAVWAWVFAFPVAVTALVLHWAPDVWLLAHVVAAIRLFFAARNHRLMR